MKLAGLLAKQGRVDDLRTKVDAGTPYAAIYLIDVLADRGETGSARLMRRFGLNPDGSIAKDQ